MACPGKSDCGREPHRFRERQILGQPEHGGDFRGTLREMEGWHCLKATIEIGEAVPNIASQRIAYPGGFANVEVRRSVQYLVSLPPAQSQHYGSLVG